MPPEYAKFYAAVGSLIYAARKAKRITQERLAAAIGYSRTSVTNIESGRQAIPVDIFVKIADACNVEVSALLPRIENEDEVDRLEHVLATANIDGAAREWIRRTMSGSLSEKDGVETSIASRTDGR
jgi:transcriptional regulator with XRE-family HTH domain